MPQPATAQLPVRLYFAAAAALAVSTVLPWFSVSVGSELSELVPGGLSSSSRPSAGGMLYLLLIATAYGAAGYALRQQLRFPRLKVVMWGVNAWLAFSLVAMANALRDQNDALGFTGITTSPTIGVIVAVGAVLSGIAASVILQRSRTAVAAGNR